MELIKLMSTQMVQLMADTLALIAIVSCVSVFFTEGIKLSYRKVFIHKEPTNLFCWITNLIIVVIISMLIVYVFVGDKIGLLYIILYMSLLTITSWSLSVLGYTFIIKGGFNILKSVYHKTEDNQIDAETEVLLSAVERARARRALDEANVQLSLLKDK